jgi:hypothetical protein
MSDFKLTGISPANFVETFPKINLTGKIPVYRIPFSNSSFAALKLKVAFPIGCFRLLP